MNKKTTITGDRYILCRFSFFGRPIVEESADSLPELMGMIPAHLHSADNARLSVCEVIDSKWKLSERDPTDSRPKRVKTLFEVEFYDEPSIDD